jgi:hypothetical protein
MASAYREEATVSIIEILKLFSLPASLVIGVIVADAAALAVRHTIQNTINASFRNIELELARRSAFIEKVYNQRFSLVIEISKKLERVRSELERLVEGRVTNDEIAPKGEMKGLTEIYEDLRVIRVVLGAELGSLLESKSTTGFSSPWPSCSTSPRTPHTADAARALGVSFLTTSTMFPKYRTYGDQAASSIL